MLRSTVSAILFVLLFALSAPAHLHASMPVPPTLVQDTAQQDTTEADDGKEDLPLEPTRWLRYTAEEGSWINLDVSPDGRTLVFDLLGDLYLMPIEGGRATALTEGMAWDVQPRFSPDGERVTFISDRSGGDNVWVIHVDGSDTTQITRGNNNLFLSPEWTPDGNYIVASTSEGLGGTAKLHLYHVEGGGGTALIREPEDIKTVGAAFGDDPRYIWFAQREDDWQYNASLPQYQLAVYDRETGDMTPMTDRYGSGFRPALSPDGRWLVYGTRYETQTGLRIRDLETGDERWLAYPVQRDEQESRAPIDVLPGYAFMPDSRSIVVSYGGQIWRVPTDGGEPTRIPFQADVDLPMGPEVQFAFQLDDDPTFDVRQIRNAVPSPDGSRLAFTALDRVWVMAWPGGEPRRLTDGDVGEFYPTWSPDGRSIAYVTWSDLEGGHIWRKRADGGGQPQRLTQVPAVYTELAWSPDGERIVALRSAARDLQQSVETFGGGLGQELVWVPATGGALETIAPAAGRSAPHFTTDADRIWAFDRGDGLVSFRWDGTDQKTHVAVRGGTPPGSENPMRASLILKAPRGDLALAQVGHDLYTVTIPWVGGETPTINVSNPDNAAFPARKLTEVGGQFPAWGSDGRRVHWSIGPAHFVYDLDRAEVVEDSLEALEEVEDAEEDADTADADPDPAGPLGEPTEAEEDEERAYEPMEVRVRIVADRDIPRGTVVLRGARAITMDGEEVIERADIVITDNRITAVGPAGQVTVPDDARVMDMSGRTIVPGFIDTHAHMWPTWGIHRADVWQYHANLAYGVTTTRDPQTATTDVLTYQDRVTAGDIIGPRIYSTGPGVFLSEMIESQDHARDVLRRYSEYYDTKTFKMYMSGNRQQRQWLIIAAEELGLMPTTEGGLDFKINMTFAQDGYSGMEHSLPIYPLYDDVVRLYAESGITYTPTLLVSYGGPWAENYWYATENPYDDPKLRRFTPQPELAAKARRRNAGWFLPEEHVFEDHARFVADLVEAGGTAGVGSHGQLQGLGYHWELWSMASGGLSNHDALKTATIMGAIGIGLEEQLGSLEQGKLADLVILEANPLDDLRATNRIEYVMKNGRLYEADTLDEVYPRDRPFEPRTRFPEPPEVTAGVR